MELTSFHFLLALRVVSNAALPQKNVHLPHAFSLYSLYSHPGSILQEFLIMQWYTHRLKTSAVVFENNLTCKAFSILKHKVQISLTIMVGILNLKKSYALEADQRGCRFGIKLSARFLPIMRVSQLVVFCWCPAGLNNQLKLILLFLPHPFLTCILSLSLSPAVQ